MCELWSPTCCRKLSDKLSFFKIVVLKFIVFNLCSSVLSNFEVLVKKFVCSLSEIISFVAHIFIIPFSNVGSATYPALLLFCSDLLIITIITISEQ